MAITMAARDLASKGFAISVSPDVGDASSHQCWKWPPAAALLCCLMMPGLFSSVAHSLVLYGTFITDLFSIKDVLERSLGLCIKSLATILC